MVRYLFKADVFIMYKNPEEVQSSEGADLPGFVPAATFIMGFSTYAGTKIDGLGEPETLAPSYTSQEVIQRGEDDDPLTGPGLVGLCDNECDNAGMTGSCITALEFLVTRHMTK
ncbi:hypothetical protein RRF57_011224 [Xylaria bambusicola]|uniref:Uncharacterized protein n=1 Tax=Xylaria bambusicola TaxID=326684 RepID=A0AAN7Z9Z0_9PEZI